MKAHYADLASEVGGAEARRAFFTAVGYLNTKGILEEREMKKAEDNAPIVPDRKKTRHIVPAAAVAPAAPKSGGFSFTWPTPK